MPWLLRVTVVLAVFLFGCATDPPVPQRPPVTVASPSRAPVQPQRDLEKIPVRAIEAPKPAPAPAASRPPEPTKEPTLAEAVAGKTLMSPFTVISPVLGHWVWINDPNFVLVFQPDGTLVYGRAQGVYQLKSESLLVLQFTVLAGMPTQDVPQEWTVQFFDNRATLLLTNARNQAQVFKRPQ